MRRRSALVALGLVALAAAIYWPVAGHGFIAYDDPRYVAQNPMVLRGLSWAGVGWAFTALYASNWHPLTWLSHMLDVQLFGSAPGAQHLVNLALHAANGALLFAVLRRATGSLWRSAFVAALFVAHPLHVESVAWVAERKDVLSTLLGLLALLEYVRPRRRMWLVALLFALGLLAKPMLVTLPLLMLLLDLWPLRRGLALREKLPLFALSLASAVATLVAQGRGGAISTAQALPFPTRLANAFLSYALYLRKAIWPTDLAIFYPHPANLPGGLSPWAVAGSVALFVAVSALVAWQWKRRPVLAFGWLWFVISLLPVIGLVQVGLQGIADRYTYLPLIGPFVALAWSVPGLPGARRLAATAASAAVIGAMAIAAHLQTLTWKDSTTVFAHAAQVVPGNWLALKNLGVEQFNAGDTAAALRSFEAALALRRLDADLWADVGTCRLLLGDPRTASAAFDEALRLDPRDAEIWFNLGVAQALAGRGDRVEQVLARLREMDPGRAQTLQQRLAELPRR